MHGICRGSKRLLFRTKTGEGEGFRPATASNSRLRFEEPGATTGLEKERGPVADATFSK